MAAIATGVASRTKPPANAAGQTPGVTRCGMLLTRSRKTSMRLSSLTGTNERKTWIITRSASIVTDRSGDFEGLGIPRGFSKSGASCRPGAIMATASFADCAAGMRGRADVWREMIF